MSRSSSMAGPYGRGVTARSCRASARIPCTRATRTSRARWVSHPVRIVGGVVLEVVLDTVFPAYCAGCDRRGAPVCDDCARALAPAPVAPPPPFVDEWVALFAYDGVARELVARIKYRNARAVVPWFAELLARRTPRVDCVTFAPTTTARRRARGFDHAQLLSRALARQTNTPHRALLARTTNQPQTGRSLALRHDAVNFHCVAGPPPPRSVLVVDDVVTTGTTLKAAARALREAGTTQVFAATVARTPAPRGR